MSSSNAPKAGNKQNTAGGGGAAKTTRAGGALPPAPNSAQVARTGNRLQAVPSDQTLQPRALQFTAEQVQSDNDDGAGGSGSSTGSGAARASAAASAAAPLDVARQLQEMQDQITRISLEADKWRAAALARNTDKDDDASSSASGQRAQRVRIERKQLAVSTPTKLAYEQASSSSALEDWIDAMELLFHQLSVGAEEHEMRLAEVHVYTDRDVRRWWSAQQEQAQREGAPIVTWEGFLQVLRAQFLPQMESQDAVNDLINIRQHQGEAMAHYFLRATRLFARTAGRFNDHAAMLIVLDRVRKEEWRLAYAIAQRDVQADKIKTLAQLRACLQREALAEPGRTQQRPGQQQGGTQQKGNKPKYPQQQKRAAAAAEVDSGGESAEDDEAATVQVAPAQFGGGARGTGAARDKCLRCRQTGHRTQECKQPDKRKCFMCNEVGHLVQACPQRAKASAPKNA
jgi:hypothetical protein